MQPTFILKADQRDITASIKQHLVSIKVTDESGIQSDSLEIRLSDHQKNIRLPRTGAELSLYLGYEQGELNAVGLFTVDELVVEGPPDTLVIRARAANFRQSLKAQKERSWDNVSLNDVVSSIASEHELTPVIAETLAGQMIAHIDQTSESDLHFMTRLAKQYDAISTIKQNRLILTPRNQGKNTSGQLLPAFSVKPEQLSRYRFTIADRDKYVAVVAHWHNPETAKKEPVRVGQSTGKPVHTLRGLQPDAEAAKAAARAKLESLERGSVVGQLTLPGNPQWKVERPLLLTGFRSGIDGDWVITRVEHSLGKEGFRTRVSVESRAL